MLGQVTERFATAKAAEIEAQPPTAQPTSPPPQQSTPAAEKTPALNAEQTPGWSVEKVAQNKELAAEISQIEDPQIRAKAERLLSGIKQEAEARQPRKELGKQLEKGFGLGDD